MRSVLRDALIGELLGPRQGHNELLSDDPLDEYVTGVLAPVSRLVEEPSPEADAEIVGPSEDGVDDEDDDAEASTVSAPILNPKSRPQSIGLTMTLVAGSGAIVDICVSWARYLQEPSQGWRRHGRCAVLRQLRPTDGEVFLDATGTTTTVERAEVSLVIKSRTDSSGNGAIVSLYLVNRLTPPSTGFPRAEDHVFQPCIRVCCGPGTRLAPVPSLPPEVSDQEELELAFLYREQPVLARGHMTAAVWREIDWATTDSGGRDTWPDSSLLQPVDRELFARPDVRTDMVPQYWVGAPELEWPADAGPPPLA